jgi:hypothetical protein
MVLEHPMQFSIALALAAHWRDRVSAINLLVSSHPYWKRVDIDLYRDKFDGISFMERPDYTWHPIRVIRWLRQIWSLKRRIKRLGINRNDVIVGLSVFSYLENIVLSTHPENLKIAVIPEVIYEECTRDLNQDSYFTPPEGWVARLLIEPLNGLHRTYCKKEKLHPDTYWRLRYRKPLPEIYDKVAVMGNITAADMHINERIYTMPYPYVVGLKDKKEAKSKVAKKKVVFFGDFFRNGLWGVEPETYAQHLNECLAYLRRINGATHQLVYRPHPAESGEELKYLDLNQFEIEKDGMLSELYFYKYREDIEAVFSVASTSSRSAFHFFLNAYAFFNVFPFDSAARAYFKKEMGNVPSDFFISELLSEPNRYVKLENQNSAKKSCQNVLDMVLKRE